MVEEGLLVLVVEVGLLVLDVVGLPVLADVDTVVETPSPTTMVPFIPVFLNKFAQEGGKALTENPMLIALVEEGSVVGEVDGLV